MFLDGGMSPLRYEDLASSPSTRARTLRPKVPAMSGIVLIDTSVWVDHFRSRNEELTQLLLNDLAYCHPMVLAELACGTPPSPRGQTLRDLSNLPHVQQASLLEVMAFVEREEIYGLGCGLVDMALLASTLLTPRASLWTLDKRLFALCDRFGVAYFSQWH